MKFLPLRSRTASRRLRLTRAIYHIALEWRRLARFRVHDRTLLSTTRQGDAKFAAGGLRFRLSRNSTERDLFETALRLSCPAKEHVKNSVCGFEIPSVRKNYLPDSPNSLAASLSNKSELLMMLERPEIPLHTNGSENDIAVMSPAASSAAAPAAMMGATAATPSSALPKPAPNSKSRFGTTSATDSPYRADLPSHPCQNWSSPDPARPECHRFCPSYVNLECPEEGQRKLLFFKQLV
jgi:hypothetical protein